MPAPSAFTEFGLDDLSGGKPLAESIYDALWANLNGNGAVENYSGKGQGGYTDAKVYATAMAMARWVAVSRRLILQINPDTVLELLAEREAMYGVAVPFGATLAERRLALRVAMQAPGSGTYGDIHQALSDVLGDQFVDLRRITPGNIVTAPVNPGAGPGLFVRPTAFRRTFRLAANVTSPGQMGGTTPIVYTMLDGSVVPPEQRLQPTERVVLEPGHTVLHERCTVASVAIVGGQAAILTTCQKPHQKGALLTTQPYPYWLSNRRHWTVELTPVAVANPEIRRQVDRLMRKMVRGVSTWALVGSAGPLLSNVSPVDTTPVG